VRPRREEVLEPWEACEEASRERRPLPHGAYHLIGLEARHECIDLFRRVLPQGIAIKVDLDRGRASKAREHGRQVLWSQVVVVVQHGDSHCFFVVCLSARSFFARLSVLRLLRRIPCQETAAVESSAQPWDPGNRTREWDDGDGTFIPKIGVQWLCARMICKPGSQMTQQQQETKKASDPYCCRT